MKKDLKAIHENLEKLQKRLQICRQNPDVYIFGAWPYAAWKRAIHIECKEE